MRPGIVALAVGLVVVAGCGGDHEPAMAGTSAVATTSSRDEPTAPATTTQRQRERRGTTVTLRSSPFGTMLFDARRQAIYVFENDTMDRSVCYGACARDWPPVYTRGTPRARGGVRQSLLGTIRRRDGRRQVTYRGRPLYFYAHESPGEVRCHNVDLNGGLWWVIGPNGRRRP